jgi:hypothetical protein
MAAAAMLCAAATAAGQQSADAPSAGTGAQKQAAAAPVAPRPLAGAAVMAAASGDGAARVASLLALLDRFDRDGRNPDHKIGFELPEKAVNDYLAFAMRMRPRPGLRSVSLKLLANNEVAVTAEVQPDVFLAWSAGLLADDVRPKLTDLREIRLNIKFEASGGKVTLRIDHGQGGAQPFDNKVLSILLQALASHQPENYDLTAPIPLPFGLQRVWTQAGLISGTT